MIRALVRDQKKGKPAPASTDESDHSDESDAPDRPFTPADDEALIAALVKAKINGREPNTVFERLVKLVSLLSYSTIHPTASSAHLLRPVC